MRKPIFLILFMFLVGNVFAKSRSSSEALTIANSFCQKSQVSTKRMSTGATLTLAYTCNNGIATRSTTGSALYYVFNIGDNNGFIIVSGDDRAKEILGYSDSGSFDINNLPPSFSTWLGFYQKELMSLVEQPESSSVTSSATTTISTKEATFSTTVPPLLGGIKWNQGSPYNNLCPVIDSTTYKRAVTGCVATAMAQVMKYHQWPVRGTGSNTYTPDIIKRALTVDFSQTAYDWANMTDTYGSTSNQTQKDAVATLMYHAGVAVNMDYGESSAASTVAMAQSLIKYFGYDANLQLYLRDYYNNAEWVSMLKTELNAKRPVLYSGSSTDVGHQFVCDGYDSNGLFHFNWGWGGSSDGYFELSALNPGTLGIGGGNSGGFNFSQDIVIGVQKSGVAATTPTYLLNISSPVTSSVTSTTRNGTFTISVAPRNWGINTFNGLIGLALYNENGFVKQLSNAYSISDLKTYYGWTNIDYNNVAIPANTSAGNYKLYSVYKPTGDTNWQIMRGKVGTPNYLNVTVASSGLSFSTPDVMPKLTLNSLTVTGNLYQSKTGRFNVSITNTGGEYNSVLVIQLKSVNNSSTTQIVSNDPINIPAGETKNFYLEGNVTMLPGQYNLSAMYDPANDRDNAITFVNLSNPITVDVLATPTGDPVFTLTSKIAFPDASNVSKSNAMLTAHIKNTGGYFDNNVVAFIFPKTGGSSLTYIGYQKMILDANEEKTVTFNGNINIDAGLYLVIPYYWNNAISSWSAFGPSYYSQLQFTLVNDGTGIEDAAKLNLAIYPNPATDKLYLKSEELVKTIRIISLTGKEVLLMTPEMSGEIAIPVNELNAGAYILQSVTEAGTQTYKFIKK